MTLNTKHIILPVLAAALLAGCSSERQPVSAIPETTIVTPSDNGEATLNIDFTIPAHYISKRSRLVITPTLVAGDSVVDVFKPLVLDASIYRKKTERMEVLHGYVDPYAGHVVPVENTSKPLNISYHDTLSVSERFDGSRIVAVVSSDGCGICSGLDTLDIAYLSYPQILIEDKKLTQQAWVEPQFVVREKIFNGKGEARLQFVVDKWDIVRDLADNGSELDKMLATLGPILRDSLTTLTRLDIFGSASAEASYSHNVMLANNRANAAKNWLASQLGLPQKVSRIIKVGAAPEGWEPVVQAMVAAGDPDSIRVRELMIKYPGPTDDAAEKYIRRLPCWPRIRDRYLAKDRKVTYEYSWTVKSFTDDAEMIEIYRTRPDSFNEEEFLHVASLAKDDDSRRQVYEKMLVYFPKSAVALSNLAYLYAEEGNDGRVVALLAPVADKTPQMRLILASAYIRMGNDSEAARLLEGLDNPEAVETLNLLKKKQLRKK